MESVTGQSLTEIESLDDGEVRCIDCGQPCGIYFIQLPGGDQCNRCFKAGQFDLAVDDYNTTPHMAAYSTKVSRWQR